MLHKSGAEPARGPLRCGNGFALGDRFDWSQLWSREGTYRDQILYGVGVCVCVWFVLRMGGVRQGFLAPAIPTKDGGCDRTIKVKCDVQVMWCHLHCLHE